MPEEIAEVTHGKAVWKKNLERYSRKEGRAREGRREGRKKGTEKRRYRREEEGEV